MPPNNNNNVAQQTTPWAVWCSRAKHTRWWCVVGLVNKASHTRHQHTLTLISPTPSSAVVVPPLSAISFTLAHTPSRPSCHPMCLTISSSTQTVPNTHNQRAPTTTTHHTTTLSNTQPTTNTTTTNGHMVPSTPTTTTTTPHRCRVL